MFQSPNLPYPAARVIYIRHFFFSHTRVLFEALDNWVTHQQMQIGFCKSGSLLPLVPALLYQHYWRTQGTFMALSFVTNLSLSLVDVLVLLWGRYSRLCLSLSAGSFSVQRFTHVVVVRVFVYISIYMQSTYMVMCMVFLFYPSWAIM